MNKVLCCSALLFWTGAICLAEETTTEPSAKAEPQMVELADGALLVPVPGNWQRGKPRNRIIAHEFQVPAVEKDSPPGRLTIMSAGGGVEANIARWVGQFRTADGKPLDDDAKKIDEKRVGALTVHLVDLTGTFQDKPRGPFGPTVERTDYRMLAAVSPTRQAGTWFIKYYAPQASVAEEEKNFATMITGLQWQGDNRAEPAVASPSPAPTDSLQ